MSQIFNAWNNEDKDCINDCHLEILWNSITPFWYCQQRLQHQEPCIHFFSYKLFIRLSDISPENATFLKTINSEFSYIKAWFGDQNSKLLEIEDKIYITLVIT